MSSNFCALPFHHVMIEPNGRYNICCQHQAPADQQWNIKNSTAADWQSSAYVAQVRSAFDQNQRHAGCENCWAQEDQGFESMRTRTAKEYQLLGVDTQQPATTNVEVNLGNLCNLKCLMCNELNSSAILAENIQLGINTISQSELKWNDQAFANLTNLVKQGPKVLNIRGGEPFYNKQLLELINSIPDHQAQNMVLHISTNATIWNAKWQAALERFKLVRMMFSVDGVGDLYEYIRFPGVWEQTKQNILEISKMKNVRPLVYTVVQNLNIAHLGDIIKWCVEQNIYHMCDMLHQPSYLQITNLPDLTRFETISNLGELVNQGYPDHIDELVQNCIVTLAVSEHDTVLWSNFVDYISQRDLIRGNDHQKFIKYK